MFTYTTPAWQVTAALFPGHGIGRWAKLAILKFDGSGSQLVGIHFALVDGELCY